MNDFITVYSGDLMRRIKSRPFIIGLLLGTLAIVALIKLPTMLAPSIVNQGTRLVIVADAPLAAQARPMLAKTLTVKGVVPAATTINRALLKRFDADSAVSITEVKTGIHVTIFAKNPTSVPSGRVRTALLPLQVQHSTHLTSAQIAAALDANVQVRSLSTKFHSVHQAEAAQGLAMTLVVFLYILVLVNSQFVMSAVAEEKTSRIAELLIATVDPMVLLVAKVLVGATLSVLQLLVWVGIGIALGSGGGSAGASSAAANPFSLAGLLGNTLSPEVIAAFIVFFILGFLQISTVFAGVASLINRTEDLGSISGPMVIPTIAGYFIGILAINAPSLPVVTVTSFVPLLSPFVMFARMAVTQVPPWQIGTSIALNVLALWGIAWFAGKLYRVGMMLYGRPPKLGQVWEILRSPS
uniref:ABC-2 type transporter transmembrane domain-containing protein n=1 Tax=mine drainage metagenome TaxID=410659 RepID=E6Q6D1_9ZZZZ